MSRDISPVCNEINLIYALKVESLFSTKDSQNELATNHKIISSGRCVFVFYSVCRYQCNERNMTVGLIAKHLFLPILRKDDEDRLVFHHVTEFRMYLQPLWLLNTTC